MTKSEIWRHGFKYAERGLYIVPLRPLSKTPAVRNWPRLATNDPERVERWARDFPDANLGIIPGKSQLVVIDVDLKSDGQESFNQLATDVGGIDVFDGAPIVRTPSGGFHVYFRKPPGFKADTQRGIVQGIDFFSTTGQVVVPPSRLREAGYEWRTGGYVEPPMLPDPIIAWLKAHERKVFAGSMAETAWTYEFVRNTDPILDTKRHPVLLHEGGKMVRSGYSPELLSAILKAVNSVRCKPPLDDWDIDSVIESLVNYVPGFAPTRYVEEWLAELSGNEITLAVALAHMAFSDGTIRVAQARIAEKTGLDRRSSSDAAKRLEEKGAVIRRFGRSIEGGREATTYKLLYRQGSPGAPYST